MVSSFRKIWENEFLRGSIILTVSSFIVNVLNYVFNLLAGRSLGPAGYGDITALFSYISIVSVPVTILSTIIIQKIASAERDRYVYAQSIENFFWVKLRKYWFMLLPAILVIPFVPSLTNLSLVSSYSLIPIIFLSFISAVYSATLQGLSLFTLVAAVAFGTVLIKLSGSIIAILFIPTLVPIVLLFVASFVFSLLMGRHFLYSASSHNRSSAPVVEKRLLDIVMSKQFIITTISIFGITLLSNIDIVFVKKFFSAQEAGIYGSWSLFAKIILYFVGPLTSVSLVYFAKKSTDAIQNKTLIFSLLLLLLIGIGSYVAYTYFSALVITMFFGNKFLGLLPYLSYASIFGSLYATITLLNNYFLAKKSAAALALPIGMIGYIGMLFVIERSLLSLMYLNIGFSAVITTIYLILYFMSLKKSS